jgi:hypothetical protein
MDGDLKNPLGLDGLAMMFDASAKPIITVDVERYQSFLDDTDLTEPQKAEFLQALWQIITNFVELGFGVHPLQEVCGKDAGNGSQTAIDAFDAVCSDEPKKNDNKDNMRP